MIRRSRGTSDNFLSGGVNVSPAAGGIRTPTGRPNFLTIGPDGLIRIVTPGLPMFVQSNISNHRIRRRSSNNRDRSNQTSNTNLWTNIPPGSSVRLSGNGMMFDTGLVTKFIQFSQTTPPSTRSSERRNRREDRSDTLVASDCTQTASNLILDDLPTYVADKDREIFCEICLEDIVRGEEIRVLPCCHQFHKNCIDPWLKTSTTCPTCKNIM